DVMIGPHKIAGSAQRRQRGALLQHGAILLARSPHAPALPGALELNGTHLAVPEVCSAIFQEFGRQPSFLLRDTAFSSCQDGRVLRLVDSKYGDERWNRRR